MSNFFIHRPIFASVIAIIIMLAGLVALKILPLAQYPDITPPTVTITTAFPGASAETIARTVAAPIEEQLSGIEHLLYFSSASSSSGSLTITVTFDVGADADQATINVNNRIQSALPRLPDEVRRNGVIVKKSSTSILLMVAVTSSNPRHDSIFLANYKLLHIDDEIKRIPGVADSYNFSDFSYSMRIWLNPERMARLGVTPTDVANAIRAQNAQYSAGKIGAEPAPAGQSLTFTVTATGRLTSPEEFGAIVVRSGGPNGVLRVRDIARVELGARGYDAQISLGAQATSGGPVFLQPGANALAVARAVRAKLDELKKDFPEGMDYVIPYDTTLFIDASIDEVIKTFIEAGILVVLVVFLFLQHWRATLIPVIAVPVSIIGTFAGLLVMGFTLNTLTLFALVLAIGIVIDDAIVVMENVERLMREQGMRAFDAAVEAMREVSGAIVAIVMVLCAVFIPVAFLGGIAGQMYKQFAVTVTIAVVISGFIALTLTPALCAVLLKPGDHESRLFRPFNAGFSKLSSIFMWFVHKAIERQKLALAAFVAMLLITFGIFLRVPTSFVPPEDQGFGFGILMLPDGASLQRTVTASRLFQASFANVPEVDLVLIGSGVDQIGGGNKPNVASFWLRFKPWNERRRTGHEIVQAASQNGLMLPDGLALAFDPPAILGLGSAGGLEFYLQSRVDADPKKLETVTRGFLDTLNSHPLLQGNNTFFRASIPQIHVDVDREKALALGVPIGDIFDALQSTMAALYVNDFNKFGRTYRVQLQADSPYRASPDDLGRVHVRSASGDMIPLKALIRTTATTGPELVDRYNDFLAAKVIGNGKPGVSSGAALKAVEDAARTLPDGYVLEWTGQSFQEKRSGSASILAFGLGMLMVYLILAALYERWRVPVAVVLAVPFALAGALGFVWLRGMNNDIYFQIGLVVLIGLAAKNAILIVEFAQQGVLAGKTPAEAAIEAAQLRFRPIVMTSLAFMLGVLPLVFSTGAGAAARQSMGTGVFGGMLVATFIAPIFVPLFFTLITGKGRPRPEKIGP